MKCWVIEDYEYRLSKSPSREFKSAVSLHNHSSESIEDLEPLNRVNSDKLFRVFARLLQHIFGLENLPGVDYSKITYRPPYPPEALFEHELRNALELGIERFFFSLTDHNEIKGSQVLREKKAVIDGGSLIAEELTITYDSLIFHLGIIGIPECRATEIHQGLLECVAKCDLDSLFEILEEAGGLVVLNHPLMFQGAKHELGKTLQTFLKRYGRALNALEYNGMRGREENDEVVALAKYLNKPLVGGGDCHLFGPSHVLSVSKGASTFLEFIEEIKSGIGMPLVMPSYFVPLGWKLTLRAMYFTAYYRRLARYEGIPVEAYFRRRYITMDWLGFISRKFLSLANSLGLVH